MYYCEGFMNVNVYDVWDAHDVGIDLLCPPLLPSLYPSMYSSTQLVYQVNLDLIGSYIPTDSYCNHVILMV